MGIRYGQILWSNLQGSGTFVPDEDPTLLSDWVSLLWSTCEPNGGAASKKEGEIRISAANAMFIGKISSFGHSPLCTFEARLWTWWQGGLARRHRGLSRIAAGRWFDWRPVGDESKPKHGRKNMAKLTPEKECLESGHDMNLYWWVLISLISFNYTELSTDVSIWLAI